MFEILGTAQDFLAKQQKWQSEHPINALTFMGEIEIEHNENAKKWLNQTKVRKIRGEYIYTDFCVWCNCEGQPELKNNAKAFALWLKNNEITLTSYQRRWIAENHFGWHFIWNEEKNDWEIKKI